MSCELNPVERSIVAKRKAIKGLAGQGEEATTAKQRAIKTISENIFSGIYKPGSVISANGLVDEMGFSKTPIREAMDVLAKDGLLRWIGLSGAIVENIDIDDIYEILRLRSMIETAVVQQLCFVCDRERQRARGHGRIIGLLEAVMDGADRARQDDGENYEYYNLIYEYDIKFHATLAEQAGMKRAEAFIRNLMNQFRVYAIDHRGGPSEVHQEHRAIFESIVNFRSENKYDGLRIARTAIMRHMRGTAMRWAPGIVYQIDEEWEWDRDPSDKKQERHSSSTHSSKAKNRNR
jgi:DNA-binding GntR family transcriptional regulator